MPERLGEELMMSSVGTGDEVVRAQRQDRSHGATFLANARVGWSVDQRLPSEVKDVLLEGADPLGVAEQLQQEVGIGRRPVLGVGRDLHPGCGSGEVVIGWHDVLQAEEDRDSRWALVRGGGGPWFRA